MAPEVLSDNGESEYCGEKADIFALGVILFMMLSGKQPFTEVEDVWHKRILRDPVKAVKNRNIKISDDAIKLIASMIAKDPTKRPSPD